VSGRIARLMVHTAESLLQAWVGSVLEIENLSYHDKTGGA
jgi:hypothetical protein